MAEAAQPATSTKSGTLRQVLDQADKCSRFAAAQLHSGVENQPGYGDARAVADAEGPGQGDPRWFARPSTAILRVSYDARQNAQPDDVRPQDLRRSDGDDPSLHGRAGATQGTAPQEFCFWTSCACRSNARAQMPSLVARATRLAGSEAGRGAQVLRGRIRRLAQGVGCLPAAGPHRGPQD